MIILIFLRFVEHKLTCSRQHRHHMFWTQPQQIRRKHRLCFFSSTKQGLFFFKTADINPQINITEAGIDHFFIADTDELSFNELESDFSVHPNPVNHELIVTGIDTNQAYKIFNPNGSVVKSGYVSGIDRIIDVSQLNQGVYFLMISSEVIKIIKAR